MMLCIKVESHEMFLRVEFQWCNELFEIIGRADWNRLSAGLLDERQSDFRNDIFEMFFQSAAIHALTSTEFGSEGRQNVHD
jgi:hypothetical protein